MKCFHFHFQPH